ncbi:MAG: hypothetical protein WDM81_17645 [Rhizomicrobium sp.]
MTEKLHLFVAAYEPKDRAGAGGGLAGEGRGHRRAGSFPSTTAMAMVADGRICDAKTVVLLQWAAAKLFG